MLIRRLWAMLSCTAQNRKKCQEEPFPWINDELVNCISFSWSHHGPRWWHIDCCTQVSSEIGHDLKHQCPITATTPIHGRKKDTDEAPNRWEITSKYINMSYLSPAGNKWSNIITLRRKGHGRRQDVFLEATFLSKMSWEVTPETALSKNNTYVKSPKPKRTCHGYFLDTAMKQV